jgi:signal transduction histidine kinase
MLYEFVHANRQEIIRRCRAKVATRSIPPPSEAEIDHGVPLFLEQLVEALHLGAPSSAAIGTTAGLHGHDLLLQGFTVSQVVHDYGDVCQSITELAIEMKVPISSEDFLALNACLDDAIARAVTEYDRECNQSTIAREAVRSHQEVGFFSHELRNLLNTALLAFEVLKSGKVGISGSTGHVLHRSLVGARDLISRSLTEIRLKKTVPSRQEFSVSDFIEELVPAATLSADARHVKLHVVPAERGIWVDADREVLAAVMMNLLQNAFKFTRPGSTVTLRVNANTDRVMFEVEDQCGGLPSGNLFRPFEQRSTDRTGLGLGLAFSRAAVKAHDGKLYARSLPDVGCVFTVELPRVVLPVLAGQ